MDSRLTPCERDSPHNGTTRAATALEAIAHGRAHLDYQRRVATEGQHRDNARAMHHERKPTA